jgi:hypothetical protein
VEQTAERKFPMVWRYISWGAYKSYHNVDIGPPVANIPLQQQVTQPPIGQPQIVQPPVVLPNILPAPPVIAVEHPIQVIVVTLLPRPITPGGCKRHQLEAIPEEDEPTKPQQKPFEDAHLSNSDNTPPYCPARREGG